MSYTRTHVSADTDSSPIQVSHILVLNSLSTHFEITYISDVSQQALDLCVKKVAGGSPKTTLNAEELITSPETDVVVICNVNAFHPSQAILALQHNKYVFVEKPLALNYRDLDAIIAAEQISEAKVFVGYQRRYAESFLDAVKEVGGMEKIDYIRVRGMLLFNILKVRDQADNRYCRYNWAK